MDCIVQDWDYWTPYAELGDYYKQTGDVKKAREVFERGLAATHDAPGLKRRLAELDGGVARKKDTRAPAAAPASNGH